MISIAKYQLNNRIDLFAANFCDQERINYKINCNCLNTKSYIILPFNCVKSSLDKLKFLYLWNTWNTYNSNTQIYLTRDLPRIGLVDAPSLHFCALPTDHICAPRIDRRGVWDGLIWIGRSIWLVMVTLRVVLGGWSCSKFINKFGLSIQIPMKKVINSYVLIQTYECIDR